MYQEKKKKTNFQRFLAQFKDVMILILIAAAVISFVIAFVEGEPKEFFEPALILLIIIVNAIMGVLQESKAEKALDALKNMSAPHARVIRDGTEKIIDASDLVPGDMIRLEAGDFVPADARLLHSAGLKSEESALTGESVPSDKDADAVIDTKASLGDRSNMVFSGCSITYGTATAVVTDTGMNTEMGKIANLLDDQTDSQTPLQKKLAQLGKYLGILALVACAIIFIVGIINGIPALEIFMTAVSLAVSAIPEGLPAIVTVVLSIGVQRMVKKNALIRRLPAVETLGSASIICSDKTGTLTQNRMTLTQVYIDGSDEAQELSEQNAESVKKLLRYGALCCDGSVVFNESGEQHIGDPTETAIVLAAHKNGMPKDDLNQKYPRLAEIPFDSDRKLMTTVNRMDGKNVVIVKGAFDIMASRCISGDIQKAKHITEEMSENALRVLAVAYKEIDTVPDKEKLLAIIDAYRKLYPFKEVVPISAATGSNTETLLSVIRKFLPEGPQYFPAEMVTDQPERQIASEIIREKALYLLQDEIPHGIAVEIMSMKKRPDQNMVDVQALIYCEKDSHKGIIIGKHGSMLKKIGTYARQDMERLLGSPIFLQIWVKVKKDWRDSDFLLKNFGYDKKNI